jgi:hypothetical protein
VTPIRALWGQSVAMVGTGERATLAISAPLMVGGLSVVARAATLTQGLSGAELIIGGAVAMGSANWSVRALGWAVAIVGGLCALVC